MKFPVLYSLKQISTYCIYFVDTTYLIIIYHSTDLWYHNNLKVHRVAVFFKM